MRLAKKLTNPQEIIDLLKQIIIPLVITNPKITLNEINKSCEVQLGVTPIRVTNIFVDTACCNAGVQWKGQQNGGAK